MRCSSCEASLDAFVEATLQPARAKAVADHLRGCTACEILHRRLRVVDALLMTARPSDLAEDFAARVVGCLGSLPAPQPPRKTLLPLGAFYLVAAWIVTVAAVVLARPNAPMDASMFARLAHGLVAALGQGTHALWPVAPLALSIVVSVLAVDALLFAAVFVFYRSVRPRLTAYLTVPAEAL
ncbi:MAG: hypothetical protein WB615_04070 [Candidatus Tumulicola sp.]